MKVLLDWLRALLIGLLLALGAAALAAIWIWWRTGHLTVAAIQTPLLVLSGILVAMGSASMGRSTASHRDSRFMSQPEMEEMLRDARKQRMGISLYPVLGGVWGFVLIFILNNL